MQRERKVGKLLLDSKPIHDANPADIIDIVCEAAKKDGLAMFAWDDDVQRLQRRVAQVSAWHPELGVPDLSTTHLLDTAAEWLPLYLQEGGRIRQTVAELKKIRLAEVLWNIIPYEMQQEIDRLAPTHIKVFYIVRGDVMEVRWFRYAPSSAGLSQNPAFQSGSPFEEP